MLKTGNQKDVQQKVLGAEQERPIHLLLKVHSEAGRTINDHAAMVATGGAAMLGKIGQEISAKTIDALNRQIERGIKTYLFLTTRDRRNDPYVMYRCLLRQVNESLDVSKKSLIPRYYVHESAKIRTWFEITSIERLTMEQMSKIFALTSGKEIMSVIRSMKTVFRVIVK
jgi:hypothetical protein